MTTQAFKQFDLMDTQALAAVEGGFDDYAYMEVMPHNPKSWFVLQRTVNVSDTGTQCQVTYGPWEIALA